MSHFCKPQITCLLLRRKKKAMCFFPRCDLVCPAWRVSDVDLCVPLDGSRAGVLLVLFGIPNPCSPFLTVIPLCRSPSCAEPHALPPSQVLFSTHPLGHLELEGLCPCPPPRPTLHLQHAASTLHCSQAVSAASLASLYSCSAQLAQASIGVQETHSESGSWTMS